MSDDPGEAFVLVLTDLVEKTALDDLGRPRPFFVVILSPPFAKSGRAARSPHLAEPPRLFSNGGRWTPRSVTMAVMYEAGVTSKAGLRTST